MDVIRTPSDATKPPLDVMVSENPTRHPRLLLLEVSRRMTDVGWLAKWRERTKGYARRPK